MVYRNAGATPLRRLTFLHIFAGCVQLGLSGIIQAAAASDSRQRLPYGDWMRGGSMEATPGEVVGYDRIRTRINELGKQYYISQVAIDRWNATQLATQLSGDEFEIIAFGQGYASMSAPTKKLEEVVLARRLRHGGHPVLRWMAGNVSIEQDAADTWKPSKKSCERIDGIVALVMALDLASREVDSRSVYDISGSLAL